MQSPASRYVFPALGTLYQRFQQYAWPIFRVAYGAFYIPHGCQKLFGWFGGNIGGTAKGMAAFIGFMAVAAFHVHWKIGYFWTGRGLEMPLLLLVLALVILIRGGGEYSVDRRVGREV